MTASGFGAPRGAEVGENLCELEGARRALPVLERVL